VNFLVEDTRVGQATDYNKLILEAWTDGSVLPQDAVAYAAKILKDHLSMFINFEEEAGRGGGGGGRGAGPGGREPGPVRG